VRQSYVLSLGMVVILLIVAPLGYLNLNKNIIVQEGTRWPSLPRRFHCSPAFC
jgi:hypothetical protein